jgi:hypothetical protein
MVYLPDRVEAYAAPTRIYAQTTNRSGLALKPSWEYQESMSGANPLGEVPLVPFSNRSRMLKAPEPEFAPAITPQRRINKTLMDRMAMQDQGAFKAMWATGLNIPKDPDHRQAGRGLHQGHRPHVRQREPGRQVRAARGRGHQADARGRP